MSTRLFKVGFATTDTPGDVQYMSSSASNNNYDSFQQGGTAFQVTSGKTLYIGQITLNPGASGGDVSFYSSTASVSNNSSAPSGNTPLGKQGAGALSTDAAGAATSFDTVLTITSTRFFNQLCGSLSSDFVSAVGLMF